MTTSPLILAIRAVRDELAAGESFDDAVALAADEQGVNPVLLARKVRESAGAMCVLPAARSVADRRRALHERIATTRVIDMLIASLREAR